MKKKYLRKNEFRDYTNPKHLSKSGKPHKAYISLRYKDNYRFNVITHSNSFFGKKTEELNDNPNRNKNKPKDNRKTKISIPWWDNKKYFSEEKIKGWRFSKIDKKKIRKFNKKHLKRKISHKF